MKGIHGLCPKKPTSQTDYFRRSSNSPLRENWGGRRKGEKKCLAKFCEWFSLHDDSEVIRGKRSRIRQLLIFYSA